MQPSQLRVVHLSDPEMTRSWHKSLYTSHTLYLQLMEVRPVHKACSRSSIHFTNAGLILPGEEGTWLEKRRHGQAHKMPIWGNIFSPPWHYRLVWVRGMVCKKHQNQGSAKESFKTPFAHHRLTFFCACWLTQGSGYIDFPPHSQA